MSSSRRDRLLDYFPILAYFGFWLQGAALAALLTRDSRLIALGLVTAPALAAMILAVIKIRKRRQEQDKPSS